VRVIPRLDVKGPNLVKGIHLEGLRVLGKPERFARHYYSSGADELLFIDAVASLYDRNSVLDILRRTAEEVFIPLTVGGGIRTTDDVRAALRSGADKVAINTAAIADPQLIARAVSIFGSSSIVVSMEVIEHADGTYECFTSAGRESTGIDPLDWAPRAQELGAGEILLTSVDRDGTGQGVDLKLTKAVSEVVEVPLIASGGVGKPDDVFDAWELGGCDAVAVASMFHYEHLPTDRSTDSDFSTEGNIDFRIGGLSYSRVAPSSIGQVKETLLSRGVRCRL
jgi:cyclase